MAWDGRNDYEEAGISEHKEEARLEEMNDDDMFACLAGTRSFVGINYVRNILVIWVLCLCLLCLVTKGGD
jgi:hypothetical protein